MKNCDRCNADSAESLGEVSVITILAGEQHTRPLYNATGKDLCGACLRGLEEDVKKYITTVLPW